MNKSPSLNSLTSEASQNQHTISTDSVLNQSHEEVVYDVPRSNPKKVLQLKNSNSNTLESSNNEAIYVNNGFQRHESNINLQESSHFEEKAALNNTYDVPRNSNKPMKNSAAQVRSLFKHVVFL